MPMRGSKPFLSGRTSEPGYCCAGQRSVGIDRDHRRHRCKAGSDIEIHQPAVQLRDRRAIFPAHARVQREPDLIRQSSVM